MSDGFSKLGGLIARTARHASDLRQEAFPVVIRLGDAGSAVLVRGVASGIATTSRAVQGGLFETMDPVIRYPLSNAALPVAVIEGSGGAVMIASADRGEFLVSVVVQSSSSAPLEVLGPAGNLTIRLATDANGDAVGNTVGEIAAAVAAAGPPWFAVAYGDADAEIDEPATEESDVPPTPEPGFGNFVRVYDAAGSVPLAPWMRIDEVTRHPSNPEWRARLGTLDRGEG